MVTYEVTIFTGDATIASTFNDVCLTLVGKEEESASTKLRSWTSFLWSQKELRFKLDCDKPLGEILMIKLEKAQYYVFPNSDWYLAKVEVKSPIGDVFHFPVYQWIIDYNVHYFREGKAVLPSEDIYPITKNIRKVELEDKLELYRWCRSEKILPHWFDVDGPCSLPLDVRFPFIKEVELHYTLAKAIVELGLVEFKDWIEQKIKLTTFDEIERLYKCHQTDVADYVHDHWREDDFFGYQFLNGVNPMLIKRCKALPPNFPVPHDVVLQDDQRLKDEMKKGNIFLCDYKILDGVKANVINEKQQYLAAPLVLLHKSHDDKLMPVAIQLKQNPSEDNPIFFPSDSEWDWLLAKTFVRNADFNVHELSAHLMRTHLLAEVFAMALMRNLPMVHPLYKLLKPHTRYTLMINCLARKTLISEDGSFTKYASAGGEGMFTILERSHSSVTYRSLCLPDDIADRGLEEVPNFYYRDDGLKLWNIINRFVTDILKHYYKDDTMVKADDELQAWIDEIFKEGFLANSATGIPEKMDTVDELIKFVTMVIFTCSAQHSAVNFAQYDFAGWMPNTPISMERPPPTKKGEESETTVLDTYPNVNTTINGMAVLWLLSKHFCSAISLGNYPEECFTEDFPLQKKTVFREELDKLSEEINERNKKRPLPYMCLDPKVVENSVSI